MIYFLYLLISCNLIGVLQRGTWGASWMFLKTTSSFINSHLHRCGVLFNKTHSVSVRMQNKMENSFEKQGWLVHEKFLLFLVDALSRFILPSINILSFGDGVWSKMAVLKLLYLHEWSWKKVNVMLSLHRNTKCVEVCDQESLFWLWKWSQCVVAPRF